MEDDKKKKRNRKKKNKQAITPTENVTLDARESTPDYQTRAPETEQNSNGQVSGIIDAPNGTEGANLAKNEKEHWVDREASFQEKIKELQCEKDESAKKEACQKEKIKQLHDEKNAYMRNEATLMENLMQLEKEKDALVQKEGSLEQRIQQLQRELDSHLQKEATLETKIQQLEGEKDSWAHIEARFEEKINQLVDEASAINLNGVSLQEKVKQMERERDSWLLKENSAKESIASLTIDNTQLRAQVIELEQSREGLLAETLQLREIISSLQLQINNLESAASSLHSSMNSKVTCEDGDANYQIEAARALVERLLTENSELVEKVNELYAELDRRGVKTEEQLHIADETAKMASSTVEADDRYITTQATDEASKMMSVSGSNQSLEDVMLKGDMNVNGGTGHSNSSEIIEEADEIVQIPLDENEIKGVDLEAALNDEKTDVPITDAPLIGAPFRLISYFARYVSGADLVEKNSGK